MMHLRKWVESSVLHWLLLDENNNGFLMNSVHSSDGCYSYTKRVKNGDSEIALSNEEKVAIERP